MAEGEEGRRRRPSTRSLMLAVLMLAVPLAPAMATRKPAKPAKPRVDPARAARERAVATAIRSNAGGWMARVYADRGYRALWAPDGRIGPAADTLLRHLGSADLDALDPSSYDVPKLRERIAAARGGDPTAVAKAELALSDSFVRYVRDQRRPRNVGMIWADPALKAKRPKPEAVLRAASFPTSFAKYVSDMAWMSPRYVELRALSTQARSGGIAPAALARLRRNLDRARILPGPWTRHVEVDASSGRLWFYERGVPKGEMRVVVGTRETQTPMLAGTLQWAIVNPYWNVPDYLVKKNIATKVLGGRTLASLKMEALSDWSDNARPVPADTIDWRAVAAGKRDLRLRELPGPSNSMGKVKFLFPNQEGIYLHDTPNRALLKKDDRHFSNGCIRLEDAPRLARWLMGKPLRPGTKPEQAVALSVPTPVYLTYLTATGGPTRLAFRNDVYGRDG
ncbi:L,D-transpeptidase family protein [Sphingomonas sp. Leaf231]|uniref:L,D-transpeptidase family protein n=1 Tax=Sphingomonas sp. Leaf231 TaxID=1736301 RepID=UPI001F022EED|nr:L,D-transpeptidase family protein [Sphingomonas sp. Leaf231]